jgi:hypothetical protein
MNSAEEERQKQLRIIRDQLFTLQVVVETMMKVQTK